MCLMIVTVRLLAWATLTLLSAMAMLASLTTPQWLVGPPTRYIPKLGRKNHSFINDDHIDGNPIRSAAGTPSDCHNINYSYKSLTDFWCQCYTYIYHHHCMLSFLYLVPKQIQFVFCSLEAVTDAAVLRVLSIQTSS